MGNVSCPIAFHLLTMCFDMHSSQDMMLFTQTHAEFTRVLLSERLLVGPTYEAGSWKQPGKEDMTQLSAQGHRAEEGCWQGTRSHRDRNRISFPTGLFQFTSPLSFWALFWPDN